LRRGLGMAYRFVSHDLTVVRLVTRRAPGFSCRRERPDRRIIPTTAHPSDRRDRMKRLAAAVVAVVLLLGAGIYAVAQQPYQLTPLDEAKRDRAVSVAGAKYHVLPATLDTTQWGWLDPSEKPKLVVNSGDAVAIETMMHAHNTIQPGSTMDDIVKLRLANPGGGPHSVTGPIYVNGAEPGHVMEIRIKKIVPKAFATNFHLPGAQFPTVGQLAPEFPQGFVRYYYLDWEKKQAEFKPGSVIDLQPCPGIIAVAPDPSEPAPKAGPPIKDAKGRTSTLRPWKNGSNMDINELQEGSTVYLPIFVKGGLIWTGDSHCRQGNGEVNLTALECSYRELVIQPVVRKDMKLEWPRIETATHWIMTGFDEDLNEAMKIATRETVHFLADQKMVPMTRDEAYALTSMVGDCRVSQVVDIRKGVHCMVPKAVFVKK
jgi:acetamidase/formamidase